MTNTTERAEFTQLIIGDELTEEQIDALPYIVELNEEQIADLKECPEPRRTILMDLIRRGLVVTTGERRRGHLVLFAADHLKGAAQ